MIGSATPASSYGNDDGTSNTGTVIGTPVPLAQTYAVEQKGDYVSAGVGMRGSGPPGGGTITLPALPGTATVTKAFLYWAVMNSTVTPSLDDGIINGNAITGTLIGTTADPCWTSYATAIHNYVADVTSYVVPGANVLTGFASGGMPIITPPLLEGASLVVVYSDPTAARKDIIIHEGAVTFSAPPAEATVFSGFSAAAGTTKTTYVVADGQPGLRNRTLVDGTETADFTPQGGGPGSDYWNTVTQDISAFVPPADTSVSVELESLNFGGYDCLTWVAQVLSVPAASTTFTVNKVYSPAGPVTSVPVSVTCTSGTPAPASGSSAPGSPFVTTVTGFAVSGATCSAVETSVPAGYTMSSNCTNVPVSNGVPASCTITNTLIPEGGGPVGGIVDLIINADAPPAESGPSDNRTVALPAAAALGLLFLAAGGLYVARTRRG
ncbi:MAG: DUF3344 domain-containing protein [Dehalococcoidia bacterium]|nr:DUF3344 domain-containing protein [Dehalococcoidia bacterium]